MSNQPGLLDKHHFLLRRLHSLTGIVPIGVFLIAHLITNSSLAWGGLARAARHQEDPSLVAGNVEYFQHEVTWINESIPHLFFIELTLWIAIAFHSILGFVYAFSGKSNANKYAYQDNKRYVWQRITGYVGILFIFYHVATLRWGWTFLIPGGEKWGHEFATSTLVAALKGSGGEWTAAGVAVSLGYFIGISMLVFHFANGMWTAAITWGITISTAAQKRWGYACAGLGVMLMLAAWSSLASAIFLIDYDEARQIELEYAGEKAPVEVIEEANTGAAETGLTPVAGVPSEHPQADRARND